MNKPIIVGDICLQQLWFQKRVGWVEADAERFGHVYGGSLDGRPLVCNTLQTGQVNYWRQQSFNGTKPENKWGKSPVTN